MAHLITGLHSFFRALFQRVSVLRPAETSPRAYERDWMRKQRKALRDAPSRRDESRET